LFIVRIEPHGVFELGAGVGESATRRQYPALQIVSHRIVAPSAAAAR
jgi:hypothetical protein